MPLLLPGSVIDHHCRPSHVSTRGQTRHRGVISIAGHVDAHIGARFHRRVVDAYSDSVSYLIAVHSYKYLDKQ